MPYGISSRPYQIDKSILNERVVDSNLQFHSNFESTYCMQTVQNVFAASCLVLHYLPIMWALSMLGLNWFALFILSIIWVFCVVLCIFK